MDRRRLLVKSGIGERYLEMSLTDYKHDKSVEIKDYIEENPTSSLIFYGSNAESYDLARLSCRGLMLSTNKEISIVDFTLVYSSEYMSEYLDKLPPLAITNFNPNSKFVDGKQYKLLEVFLHKYINNNKQLIVHFPCDSKEQIGDLASPVLIDRLEKNSKVFHI